MRLNKIKNNFVNLALIALLTLGTAMPAMAQNKAPKMTKQERVCLRNGNKLYEKKRYAEAEVEYRKALQANPASEKAQFNLATALMRQGSVTSQENDDKNPMKQALRTSNCAARQVMTWAISPTVASSMTRR